MLGVVLESSAVEIYRRDGESGYSKSDEEIEHDSIFIRMCNLGHVRRREMPMGKMGDVTHDRSEDGE